MGVAKSERQRAKGEERRAFPYFLLYHRRPRGAKISAVTLIGAGAVPKALSKVGVASLSLGRCHY